MRFASIQVQANIAPPSCSFDTDDVCAPIKALAAAAFAVSVAEMDAGRSRCARVAIARQTAMYLAHVALGLNFSSVGRAFGRDRTTVAYACDVIERHRDNPRVDAILMRLEAACVEAVAEIGRPQ